MRRFCIFKRGQIFYAQLLNPQTGKYMTAKSTGKKDRDEAIAIVADWMRDGLPTKKDSIKTLKSLAEAISYDSILTGLRSVDLTEEFAAKVVGVLKERGAILAATLPRAKSAEPLVCFMRRFWNFETSDYVREKRLHGQSVGLRRCLDQTKMIPEWEAWFGLKVIGEIICDDLRNFSMSLADKGNAPATINHKLEAGAVALRWAHNHDMIEIDPTVGLRKFSGRVKVRGILTEQEVCRLFSLEWKDRRAYIGNILAATTGLRAGEILALKSADIGQDRLFVNQSWNHIENRLKGTKTEKPRVVPLLPSIREMLLDLVQENPHGQSEDAFIFYGLRPDRPMVHNVFREHLDRMLEKIDISHDEKIRRGICFHSWRHQYATKMANFTDERHVMKATGHSTEVVFNTYAGHELEQDIIVLSMAAKRAFQDISSLKVTA